MTTNQHILIICGQLGHGHVQAARAVKEVAGMVQPDAEVQVVDFMEWNYPYIHQLSRYLFIQSVKNFPNVWGYLYQKTRYDSTFTQLCKKIRTYTLKRMMRLINEVRPSVVVCTFPLAAAAMSVLKSRGLTNVPTVTIITDHTDHSYWIHPYTDHYIVGSSSVRDALQRLGIPECRVSVTGIPVRPHFYREYDRMGLAVKHQLDPHLKTILVMGGGCGLIGHELTDVMNDRQHLPEKLQFIVVCGSNEKLYERMTEELTDSPHRIIITRFVEHIHEYMVISDLIITKPGGLTSSEAVTLSIPMLLYKPLPGQEQDNASVLVEAGVAVEATDAEQLRQLLRYLLDHPAEMERMKGNARSFRKQHSCIEAFDVINQVAGRASTRTLALADNAV